MRTCCRSSLCRGSLSNSSGVFGEFFSFENTVLELAAGVTQPIFNGGTLKAQQRAAVAQFDRAAAQYRGTVLNAFTDVADVLAALQRDAETLQVQLYAEETARQSLDITTERFQAGAIAYLSLLDAQRIYQQARILLVIAQANRYSRHSRAIHRAGRRMVEPSGRHGEYVTTPPP